MENEQPTLTLVLKKIDTLASEVTAMKTDMAKGFERVDQRFEKVDQQFAALNQKIDREIESLAIMTQNGFKEMDAQFVQMNGRFDGVEGRLERIENISTNHEERIHKLESI